MSLGIEIGNDFMVVTAIRQGVDVLQNDIGKRKTRVAVTYGADDRIIGDDSYAQYISKFNMTATYFKRLLGKQYGVDDEDIQKELAFLPNKFTQPNADGTPASIMFQIPRVGALPPEQALCTMLLKAKQIYEINSENQPVQECVITVPTYFNNAQRFAVMNAAQMANLKVLELTNETTAILYQYGLQRQITDERLVMFYDMGATTTSCTLARITPESAEVLAYEANPHLGGRDLIECIVNDVAQWCETEKKIKLERNSKSWIKLRRACEKTFQTLSANQVANVTVENLTETFDLSRQYTRETFNKVLEDNYKDKILAPVNKIVEQFPGLLKDGQLGVSFFEIVGGVTRVPYVQNTLINNFGITLSKTIDADEGIARGAALRCAALSTTKKIRRKFVVTEKKLQVNLQLYSLPEAHQSIKEGDALDVIKFTEENVLATKSFGAAYPTTYPQPRLLSIKFQQVQLPIVVGIKINGSNNDNLRALVLPQSAIDGRLFAETGEGNAPVDIKVSLSLNSSGYMQVYKVETIPKQPEVPAPQPVETPASPSMNDSEQPAAPAPAPQEQEAPKAEQQQQQDDKTMSDEPKVDAEQKTEEEAPKAAEGEQKTEEEAPKAAEAEGEQKTEEEAPKAAEGEQQQQEEAPKAAEGEQQQQQEQQTMSDEPKPQEAPAPAPAPTPVEAPVARPIPLCVYNQAIGNISRQQLKEARDSEQKLQERDAATRKRQEVYNNLESFLFTTRSRLNDANDLQKYMTPADCEKAKEEIKKLLTWVDDEAYCADLAVLQEKLQQAQKFTHEAEVRARDHKNLVSSHFAYHHTLEEVLKSPFITHEHFKQAVDQHIEMEQKAKEATALLFEKLPVTSQQVDKQNDHLRKVLAALKTFNPDVWAENKRKKEEEEARKKAEEEQKKLQAAAYAAFQAQQAAQAQAAAEAQAAAAAAQAQAEAEAQAAQAQQAETPAAQEGGEEAKKEGEEVAAPVAQEEEAKKEGEEVVAKEGDAMVDEPTKTEETVEAAAKVEEEAPAQEETKAEETKAEETVEAAKVEDTAMVDEVAPAPVAQEEEKKEEEVVAKQDDAAMVDEPKVEETAQ